MVSGGRVSSHVVGARLGHVQPLLALAVVLTLLVCNACGKSAPPPASIATTIAAGEAALRQGEYSAAEQLFQQVITRDPREIAGYYDLGLVYQTEQRRRLALEAYARALRINPNYVPAIFNKAVLQSSVDPQLAIFLYRRVISIQHRAPTAYLNLGLLEAKQGPRMQKEAARDLAVAVRMDPSLAARIPAEIRSRLAHVTVSGASPRTTLPTPPST